MNGIRKILFLITAITMTALAVLPGAAFAADKTYTLNMSSTGASPATVTALFNNKGNSSFNSLTLSVPAGYTLTGTPTASRGVVTYSGGVVTVLNINLPTGSGQTLTVNMPGVVAGTGSCGSGISANWTAVLWTGSTLSGSNFLKVNPSNTTTTIAPLCYTVSGSTATGGTVTCSPATVTAGSNSTCSVSTTPGYTFNGFSANCGAPATATSCTVGNVQSNQTVTGSFTQINYAINGSSSAGGAVTCNPTSVTYGQSSLCTVAINPGYNFTGFSTNCGAPATATSCTVGNVQAPQTVTATFSQIPYAINGSIVPGGTVTCTPSSVTYGQSSVCSVAVNPLYTFNAFSGNCGAPTTATSCTVSNVQSSQTVTATFTSNVLAITSQPTSAALSPPTPGDPTPFGVTVTITPGGPTVTPDTSACGNATWTSSGTGPTTFTFTIPKASNITSCTIVFNAPNYNPATLSNLPVYAGTLNCGSYADSYGNVDTGYSLDPDADMAYVIAGGSGWGLRRGPNKDNAVCVKVNYTCALSADNIATCTWDKLSGQQATFNYVFVWNAVDVGSKGWKDYQPLVSWGVASPGTGVPYDPTTPSTFNYNWMPGLACVNDTFPTMPAPPTLPSNPDLYPMAILPLIPAVPPYSNSTLNLLPQYQPGKVADVCISQQGSTSVGTPSSSSSSRPVTLQFWHKVIDEADVTVKGPTS